MGATMGKMNILVLGGGILEGNKNIESIIPKERFSVSFLQIPKTPQTLEKRVKNIMPHIVLTCGRTAEKMMYEIGGGITVVPTKYAFLKIPKRERADIMRLLERFEIRDGSDPFDT